MDNAKKFEEEFLPSLWKNITPEEKQLGHGGMDWFSYKAFFDALQQKQEMPVDVYDSATWQSVAVLSEISIQQGGAPKPCPISPTENGSNVPRKTFANYKTEAHSSKECASVF